MYSVGIQQNNMIKFFKHKSLRKFCETGSTSDIQPKQATKLRTQLLLLDSEKSPQELNIPSWTLHPFTGNLQGHWSITVNANWCITCRFEDENAYVVDYH